MITIVQYPEQLDLLPDFPDRQTLVSLHQYRHPLMDYIIGQWVEKSGDYWYVNYAHPDAASLYWPELTHAALPPSNHNPIGTRLLEPLSQVIAELTDESISNPPLTLPYYQDIVYPAFESLSFTELYEGNYPTYELRADKARPTAKLGQTDLMTSSAFRELLSKPGHVLLEYDMRQYHFQILAKMIGWDIPEDYYQWIGDKHMHREVEDKRKEGKKLALYMLYREDNKDKGYEMAGFEPIGRFREFMREQYEREGGFISPISVKKIQTDGFKYGGISLYLQTIETETNAGYIRQWQIDPLSNSSPIIAYVYDSFLLRVPQKQLSSVIDAWESILQGYTYTRRSGEHYDHLKRF